MATNTFTLLRSVRFWLIVTLLCLAGLTAYQQYRPAPVYSLAVRKNPSGWGYAIQCQGRVIIDQPTVPAQTGTVGFLSESQARRVGAYVLQKVQADHTLPTLTPGQLHRLGVSTF